MLPVGYRRVEDKGGQGDIRNYAKDDSDTFTMLGTSHLSDEQLDTMMKEASMERSSPVGALDNPSRVVMEYLLRREPQFFRCLGYRNKGWVSNKDKGDAFFRAQREKADKADHESEGRFYQMMQEIAMQMEDDTSTLKLPCSKSHQSKVLDICMAPGGYAAAMLKINPHAKVFGITLGVQDGGHPLLIPKSDLAGIQYLDVTLLYREYSNRDIPIHHPDRKSFLSVRPFKFHTFDLVFCDGIKLRTQTRATYREENEVIRYSLATSQLILALQRVRDNGTLVMLLHKVDSWSSTYILYTLSKFAVVQTFKPLKKHQTRSSFYMIATNIKPQSVEAITAVQEWKDTWWKATFGGPSGTGQTPEEPSEKFVNEVLKEFGPRLILHGRDIWRIQADALSKTDYAGDGPFSATTGGSNRRFTLSSPEQRKLYENAGFDATGWNRTEPVSFLYMSKDKNDKDTGMTAAGSKENIRNFSLKSPSKETGAWTQREESQAMQYRRQCDASGIDTSSWAEIDPTSPTAMREHYSGTRLSAGVLNAGGLRARDSGGRFPSSSSDKFKENATPGFAASRIANRGWAPRESVSPPSRQYESRPFGRGRVVLSPDKLTSDEEADLKGYGDYKPRYSSTNYSHSRNVSGENSGERPSGDRRGFPSSSLTDLNFGFRGLTTFSDGESPDNGYSTGLYSRAGTSSYGRRESMNLERVDRPREGDRAYDRGASIRAATSWRPTTRHADIDDPFVDDNPFTSDR